MFTSATTDELIINAVGREELDFLDTLFLSNEDLTVWNSSSAAAKTIILKAIQQKSLTSVNSLISFQHLGSDSLTD
jgi:hypothetical protein